MFSTNKLRTNVHKIVQCVQTHFFSTPKKCHLYNLVNIVAPLHIRTYERMFIRLYNVYPLKGVRGALYSCPCAPHGSGEKSKSFLLKSDPKERVARP